MLIKKTFIDRIHEEVDIVAVVQRFCPELKKKGANYFCSSPFAKDKTASFSVSPSKQIFKCFSTGKAGNAISFLMESQGLSFPDAVKWLADFSNLPIEYEDTERAQKALEHKNKQESLRPILKACHRQYSQQLLGLEPTHKAWQEIERRGYDKDTVLEWGLGYAPGGSFIYDQLAAKGISQEGRSLGLIGDKVDKYWDRLLYPLHDHNGLLVGFAGRDLSGRENSAKWINPADNILYHKDKVLFALDRARREISRQNEVYVAEGYNDVIAWHRQGLINTVAPCGTAITERQIAMLRRLTDKVCFVMDGDKAGLKAMLKYIPEFIKAGFSTHAILLPDCDPDDFVRQEAEALQKQSLPDLIEARQLRVNGFRLLLDHLVRNAPLEEKAKAVKMLTEVIGQVEDPFMQQTYTEWLTKESGTKAAVISRLIKDGQVAQQVAENTEAQGDIYQLPEELKKKVVLKDLIPTIEKYGIFVAGHRIWVKRGTEPPYSFSWVSNFSIEIIQHMNDEKFPMKLLRITNVFGKEKIFDTPSESIMTPLAFANTVAGHGNYFFKGNRQEHLQLLQYLFDQMGDGEKIDVLGWQKPGFFVFNNKVVVPGEASRTIDENGVFKMPAGANKQEICYYVPSANRVYANNAYKYESQKKVIIQGPMHLTFGQYAAKIKQVHREHAITGLLFAVASLFQDLVVRELGNFPMVFLYGPPSSGKDQLIECAQGLFGKPQTAINLEGGASTAKAQIRETAQFANLISHLSEYKRGDSKLDGMLKGMWDRRGYKRGTIDSHVGSESIPVLSSIFLTGNDYPDNDALITRLIAEEMTKTEFDETEKRQYEELSDMKQAGVSVITEQLLQFRSMFEQQFKERFREKGKVLNERFAHLKAPNRMVGNMAVLYASYDILKDQLQWPFTAREVEEHFQQVAEAQMRKLKTAGVLSKFWDCFLAVCRTKQEPLRNEVDFRIKDDRLYFNFSNTYNRVAPQWYRQYYEAAPAKNRVLDLMKETKELSCDTHSSIRFDGTTKGIRTSAHSVCVSSLSVRKEIIEAIEWQENNLDPLRRAPQIPAELRNLDSDSSTPNPATDDELPF